jgi:hypothetical protein
LRDRWRLPVDERIETPTEFAHFPGETSQPPRKWVERSYRLRRRTDFAHDEHFAALEQPVALVSDVREFFRPVRFPTWEIDTHNYAASKSPPSRYHFRVTGVGVEREPPPGPGHHQLHSVNVSSPT